MSRPLALALALAAPLALPGIALAQSADLEEAPANVRYQKQTEIEFDAAKLTGEIADDSFNVVIERRSASFNPLITLRVDFNDHLRASVGEVR